MSQGKIINFDPKRRSGASKSSKQKPVQGGKGFFGFFSGRGATGAPPSGRTRGTAFGRSSPKPITFWHYLQFGLFLALLAYFVRTCGM